MRGRVGVRGRGLLVDMALLLVVAIVLAAVHWLVPPGVRRALVLDYASPDPLHAWMASFVHLTDAHLRGNVVGLVVAGGFAVLLAHLADGRRWFRLSTLVYLTVLPVIVGMTAAVIVDADVMARGFSGVVAAYVGFVLASPGVLLPRSFGLPRWVGWNAVAGVVILVGAEIIWVLHGGLEPRAAVTLGVGLLVVLALFARPALDPANRPDGQRDWTVLVGAGATVGVVLVVVSTFVVGLFPADIVRADGVTNILAHYLGLVYGAVVAAWGSRYWVPVDPVNRGS